MPPNLKSFSICLFCAHCLCFSNRRLLLFIFFSHKIYSLSIKHSMERCELSFHESRIQYSRISRWPRLVEEGPLGQESFSLKDHKANHRTINAEMEKERAAFFMPIKPDFHLHKSSSFTKCKLI